MTRNAQTLVSMLVLAFAAATGFAASSQVINVDFNTTTQGPNPNAGTYSGTAADLDDPGTFWNGVTMIDHANSTQTVSSGLKYSDGSSAMGVSFSVTDFSTLNAQGQYSSMVSPPWTNTIDPDLFGDLLYWTSTDSLSDGHTSGTLTISGLIPGAPYDIYLYSMTGYPNNDNTVFTVNGVTTAVDGDPRPSPAGQNTAAALEQVITGNSTTTNYGNYALYTFISATGGNITVNFAGTNGRFNGLQLEVVPEPASLGLLVVGGVMLLRRRRAS